MSTIPLVILCRARTLYISLLWYFDQANVTIVHISSYDHGVKGVFKLNTDIRIIQNEEKDVHVTVFLNLENDQKCRWCLGKSQVLPKHHRLFCWMVSCTGRGDHHGRILFSRNSGT